MTTLTGDWTKAQILAQALEKQTSNRQLSIRERKAIQTANDYTPAASGNWSPVPTTIDGALNTIGAIVHIAATTSAANSFTASQTITNGNSLILNELTANGTGSVAIKAPDAVSGNTAFVMTLPQANAVVVGDTATQILTTKSMDSSCALTDATDTTKQINWNLAAQSTGVNLTITSGAEVADRTISIPVLGGNKTLAFIDLAQTVSAVNTFTAANVHYSTMTIVDAATTPKAIGFTTASATASTTITLSAAQTTNITVNLPTASGTIALTSNIGTDVRATATVSLAKADVEGAYAAPKLLIAAPSAGQAIIVELIEVLHSYSATQFDTGAGAYVQYDSTIHGAGTHISSDLDSTVKEAATTNKAYTVTSTALDMAAITAKGVYFSSTTAYANGGAANALKIRVSYRVVTVVA